MKNSIHNIGSVTRIATICALFSLPFMSFQVEQPVTNQVEITCDFSVSAYFTVSNNGCEGPCEMIFNNQSTGATSYLWDFGDGNTSTAENPSHTYQDAGTYTVRLQAIGIGETAEFVGTVDVILI